MEWLIIFPKNSETLELPLNLSLKVALLYI